MLVYIKAEISRGKHKVLPCATLFEKRIEILLSHKIRTKKNRDFLFLWFNVSRLFSLKNKDSFYDYLFFFFFFGSMFQETSCTSTPLYIVQDPSYHLISNTFYKEWCHLSLTFQWHLPSSNFVIIYNFNLYVLAITKEEGSLL